MDLSLLFTDDQRQSPPVLADSQTGDCVSVLHSPTVNMLSAHEAGTDTVSDLSVKSTLNLSQEKSTDTLTASPSPPDIPHCFPVCSEPSPEDDSFRPRCCSDSSESVLPPLPQLSHDYASPQSETLEFYSNQESPLSFYLMQEKSIPESFGALPSISEAFFTSAHGQATSLLRSLSPQSDNLDSDTAVAPMSDLYIFESETRDFILSSTVDPHEIGCPGYRPLSQTEVEKVNRDAHALMCDSVDIVTQCHHGSSEERAIEMYESDVSQHAGLGPPAADAWEVDLVSVNDVRREKAEVTGSHAQLQRSDSPIELWLDACQYLAVESTKGWDALSKPGNSGMQGGFSATGDFCFPPGDKQVSDYNPDGSEGIGWSSDDTRNWGPPVERWSSVDSWASALSDWTGIIEAPPQDITAAFAEIGAEIDALTQALAEVNTHIETETEAAMGVQDQPMKAQSITDSSIHSGQSCLPLCLETKLRDREGSQAVTSLCDSEAISQKEKEPEELLQNSPRSAPQHSSMCSLASPGGYVGNVAAFTLTPGSAPSASDLDLSPFAEYSQTLDSDIFISREEDPIILNITEDTDLDAPERPFGDGLFKVTGECRIQQLGFEVEAKTKQRCLEPSVDDHESTANLNLLTTLTNSHVPGVDTQPGLHIDTHTASDTLTDLDGARQVGPQLESPKFIMPLAPLGIGSSLVCRKNRRLEVDQACAQRSFNDNRELTCDHIQRCDLRPSQDGITAKPSLEGDEQLIHEKQNTTNTTEKSLPASLPSDTVEGLYPARKTINEEITDLSRDLQSIAFFPADHFVISEEKRVAYVTLDLNDPFLFKVPKAIAPAVKSEKMPHKTRSKKDKSSGHQHGAQASKKQESICHHGTAQQTCKGQETHPAAGENHTAENKPTGLEAKETKLVIETGLVTEKSAGKPHGKKKKKHGQSAASVIGAGEHEAENGAKPKTAKGRIDMFEAKLGAKAGGDQSEVAEKKKSQQSEAKTPQGEQPPHHTGHKDHTPNSFTSPLSDDVVKRRRLSEDKFGKIVSVLEAKLPKSDVSVKAKGSELKAEVGGTRKKAYSDVVKQKTPPKEDPKVVQQIQAASVSGDPQSLCLWCQFAAVFSDYTVNWSRDGTVLSEIKRSAGDESRVSLTINNASNKHLGKYQCRLSSSHGSVILDYLLTYEVLSEIVIPPSPKTVLSAPVEVSSEEEDVHCSSLMFKENFLTDQYFGENHPASILTEKVHFGEGMHRRAFRTKLQAGQIPLLLPGHPCVLKVHNSISYGTKNNDELVQKNFTLAVEECQVQNTAREYIKEYTTAAQSVEAFGDVPEIIPIYLVHRPSNDIPYATLEEELIGDFVKYSVKDGKEINLMRRDSEAGQKCCAFQHWVYHRTEGNLLVTDMQDTRDSKETAPRPSSTSSKLCTSATRSARSWASNPCSPKPKRPRLHPNPNPNRRLHPRRKCSGRR
ncbi:alpha-protein kinase 2 isoform X2 [Mugil cephalus]|uniref:alpha-protein kinase 2 isoform X2 n=1 Tax=Mugil cephalus TaxID=48193 RepID=UPI001FB7BC3B|nr:alpha-protein kinase 2 isoform X2 [Mugil cephalus]